MKKITCFFMILAASTHAFSGQIVYKTMYVTNTIVQGTGQTYEAAVKDAIATIPIGYQQDLASGQVIECTISEDMLRASSGEKCDTSIGGNQFRITIPIITVR